MFRFRSLWFYMFLYVLFYGFEDFWNYHLEGIASINIIRYSILFFIAFYEFKNTGLWFPHLEDKNSMPFAT